jgi:hypothetical protein
VGRVVAFQQPRSAREARRTLPPGAYVASALTPPAGQPSTAELPARWHSPALAARDSHAAPLAARRNYQ